MIRPWMLPTALSFACASPPTTEGSVELGTGAPVFAPLSDGDHVMLVHGAQGGTHIWGAIRGSGFEPRDLAMRFRLMDGDSLLASADYVDTVNQREGMYTYASVPVVFVTNQTERFVGMTYLFTLAIEDRREQRLSDEVEVVIDEARMGE